MKSNHNTEYYVTSSIAELHNKVLKYYRKHTVHNFGMKERVNRSIDYVEHDGMNKKQEGSFIW